MQIQFFGGGDDEGMKKKKRTNICCLGLKFDLSASGLIQCETIGCIKKLVLITKIRTTDWETFMRVEQSRSQIA